MQAYKLREKARKFAMQALYGWHISKSPTGEIEQFYRQDRNPKNFDLEYFKVLLHNVPANIDEIDDEITQFIDRPFKDLGCIELSILRVACYEMLYCLEVPFRVVIFEAIELAKTFASEDSYKFINRVLDKMAHKLRIDEVKQKEHA